MNFSLQCDVTMHDFSKIHIIADVRLKYDFVETPRKFIIAKLPIREPGSSSVKQPKVSYMSLKN